MSFDLFLKKILNHFRLREKLQKLCRESLYTLSPASPNFKTRKWMILLFLSCCSPVWSLCPRLWTQNSCEFCVPCCDVSEHWCIFPDAQFSIFFVVSFAENDVFDILEGLFRSCFLWAVWVFVFRVWSLGALWGSVSKAVCALSFYWSLSESLRSISTFGFGA